LKDKARNQTFEDENRQIDLELRRAALEKEKARAKAPIAIFLSFT
jgi:hypothetical protein